MSKTEVRLLKEIEYSQWDQLVERSDQGTIFHSSKWMTTAAKNLYLDPVILGVFKDAELIGGCSFYHKKKIHLFKMGYTKIPLAFFGGFVLSLPKSTNVRTSEGREHEIISLILEKINTCNLTSITLINSPAFRDMRPFTWQGWKTGIHYTYILDLDTDIFSSITHDVRKSIRKAQKLGITVKKEYHPDIFWELTKQTYEKQNKIIPFQKEYLFNVMEMLIHNNLGEMWIAETSSGDTISSVFNVYDTHLAHGWTAANDPKFLDTGGVSLLLFETFKDLQSRGFHRFNLMSGNTPAFSKFSSGFNPRLIPYYSVEKTKGLGKLLPYLISTVRYIQE
jgi:hypothetical protein